MRIFFLYKFEAGPWGGGNQFLRALKKEFQKANLVADNPKEADVILFNSHHLLKEALLLKLKFPSKFFVHRIDGPIFLVRGKDRKIDQNIFKASQLLADLSIFQSDWSFKESLKLGFKPDGENLEVILNAPDPAFNQDDKKSFNPQEKVKVVATSWSSNPRKGFATYEFLDRNLDFSRFEFTFIGNSPVEFKNIKVIKPLATPALAKELKKHDIFITGSVNDPCSNSLIEALASGLPAVAQNSGGHPEIIKRGGELFVTDEEALQKIKQVAKNYSSYQRQIAIDNMATVSRKYIEAMKKATSNGSPKKPSFFKLAPILLQALLNRF